MIGLLLRAVLVCLDVNPLGVVTVELVVPIDPNSAAIATPGAVVGVNGPALRLVVIAAAVAADTSNGDVESRPEYSSTVHMGMAFKPHVNVVVVSEPVAIFVKTAP